MSVSTVKNVGKNKKIIGRFYANWCGHCQRMADDWNKLKNRLDSDFKEFSFFDIEHGDNMEKHKKDLEEHVKGGVNVNGFPTIFKVIDGNIEYFNHSVHTNGKTLYDKIRNFYLGNSSR
jgi:thiol-disulfide isomerase/thioredoxin